MGYFEVESFNEEVMVSLTPQWAAPEVLQGEAYTVASDVYSTAMVVWECFSGEIPYGTMWPAEVFPIIYCV